MENFKICHKLKAVKEIEPWGNTLHWFGLTDGLLWIKIGESTIYEYSEEAIHKWPGSGRYSDYQIARFLEDFSEILPYVGEPIPFEFYRSILSFEEMCIRWKEKYLDEEDAVFDRFYDDKLEPLYTWYEKRTMDSGHLIGGPVIRIFRYEDKVTLLWNATSNRFDTGERIWAFPSGKFELSYDEFVHEVKRFYNRFYQDMDRQVEAVVNGTWEFEIDQVRLEEENRERKEYFNKKIDRLLHVKPTTNWKNILALYDEMKHQVNVI